MQLVLIRALMVPAVRELDAWLYVSSHTPPKRDFAAVYKRFQANAASGFRFHVLWGLTLPDCPPRIVGDARSNTLGIVHTIAVGIAPFGYREVANL